MSKEIVIKLNNPYSEQKEISLFGIDDFDGKQETTTETVAENLIDDTYWQVEKAGQSWINIKDVVITIITVKYLNTFNATVPQYTRLLEIFDVTGIPTPANLTGLTPLYALPIESPAFIPSESYKIINHNISFSAVAGKKYAFQIKNMNPSVDDDFILAVDSSGNFINGGAFVNTAETTHDLFFKITGETESNVELNEINDNNYSGLVKSLVMNPQPINNIRVISDNAAQRLAVIDIINRDIIGNETLTQALQSAAFVSNKDLGNITEIKLEKPFMLGQNELKYIIEPNSEVILIFSFDKNIKKTEVKEIKKQPRNKVLKSLKDKEFIKTFIEKEKSEQIKIIMFSISATLLMFYLFRKVIL